MRQLGCRLGQRMLANEAIWSTFQRQSYTLGHLDQVCLVTLDKKGEIILTGSDEGTEGFILEILILSFRYTFNTDKMVRSRAV